jgi:hypothetical protein
VFLLGSLRQSASALPQRTLDKFVRTRRLVVDKRKTGQGILLRFCAVLFFCVVIVIVIVIALFH